MTDAHGRRRTPLAARSRGRNGCRRRRDVPVDASGARASARPPPARRCWANLGHPFTVGPARSPSAVSSALAARRRVHQPLDDRHLHRPGAVRRARPRPGRATARAARRQRAWGDRRSSTAVFAILVVARAVARRADTRSSRSARSSRTSRRLIANFEQSDFYTWMRGHLRRPGRHDPQRGREVLHEPGEPRGDRRRGAQGRRRHRHGDLGLRHRHRAEPVLPRGAARASRTSLVHARARAQPARRCAA